MLANWVYDSPIWLVGGAITAVVVLASWGSMIAVSRWLPTDVRQAHNEALFYVGNTVGVLVAVLLALVTVVVWENYSRGEEIAATEATRIGDLLRDSAGLPEMVRKPIRAGLAGYIDVVINEEWPAQRAGKVEDATFVKGWDVLVSLDRALARYQPEQPAGAIRDGQMLRALNDLYDARRARIIAAQKHLPPLLWAIMVIGSAITVGCTFFFGLPRFSLHLLMTGVVAISLTLVFLLIIVLDYPFRGELSVPSDAYKVVRSLNLSLP